jgi:hypothetical protein
MAKKTRKFGDGGDIMVKGVRPQENYGSFNLASMGRGMSGMGGTPFGGGSGSQRLTALTPPSVPARTGPTITPATVSQPQSAILGAPRTPTGYGANLRLPFKKGGEVKKMAKGGSTASKRADGCATKGKTKGRFV